MKKLAARSELLLGRINELIQMPSVVQPIMAAALVADLREHIALLEEVAWQYDELRK